MRFLPKSFCPHPYPSFTGIIIDDGEIFWQVALTQNLAWLNDLGSEGMYVQFQPKGSKIMVPKDMFHDPNELPF